MDNEQPSHAQSLHWHQPQLQQSSQPNNIPSIKNHDASPRRPHCRRPHSRSIRAADWFIKAAAGVTIIERVPSLRSEGGQAVDIRTTGMGVVRKLPGMDKTVRSKRASIEGIAFVDSHGQSVVPIGATGSSEQQGLVSEYVLSRILYELTKDDPRCKDIFRPQIEAMKEAA